MKKWMIAVLTAVFAITASLYVFIPNTIVIQKSVAINISQQAIRRLMIENSNWTKGWPGNDTEAAMKDNGRSVSFNGNSYSVVDRTYSSILLAIHRGNDTIATSSINIVEVSKGTVKMDWETFIPVSNNPARRLKVYQESKKIENDVGSLLHKMESFYSKAINVYGLTIRQEPVVDSILLSTYDSSKGFPKTEFIYSLITKLKNYTVSWHANITGYPMLNIYTQDSIHYITKVALPVDKKLPSSGKITYKWMLPRGNILVAEVKGGANVIDHAFQQMEYYIKDYGRNAPAIPFLSLVSDRMLERDSTKWVTRIYYPVME